MKKVFSVLALCLCLTLLAGCNGNYYYVSDGSSAAETSSKEVSDPVPPFVFGEKGFYDTVNDAEFCLAEGLYAVEIGELLYQEDGNAVYLIAGAHESYLLCDGEGRVYKNVDLPWTVTPGEEGFAEAYPALKTADDEA